MAKFVLAYHGGGEIPESEEAQQKELAAWGAWFEQLGDAILDGGNPIARSVTVGPDRSVSDGGGANPLSGYSLVRADDLDAAVEMARGCPILSNGGSVEVAEAIAMTPDDA